MAVIDRSHALAYRLQSVGKTIAIGVGQAGVGFVGVFLLQGQAIAVEVSAELGGVVGIEAMDAEPDGLGQGYGGNRRGIWRRGGFLRW